MNVIMDLVMTFKVTINNIERGRGLEMSLSFPLFCFQECIFRGKSLFLGECLNNFTTACSSLAINMVFGLRLIARSLKAAKKVMFSNSMH